MDISEELKQLKALFDGGALSAEEFAKAKARLLDGLQGGTPGVDAMGAARSGGAARDSLLDLYPGQEVGPGDHRFRLVEPLGSGGMGVVWRAVDLRDSAVKGRDLHVALKMLPPDVRASAVEYKHLKTEALRARELSHPHIVNVYDWHEDPGGWVFLAMEYLQGRNLDQVLAHEGPEGLPLPQVMGLLDPVAEAIDWAYHEHRLIHRDLKPGNVFLTQTNRIKVLDFGLSAEARSSSSVSLGEGSDRSGTLAYMPPEAFSRTHPRPSRDVYGLAVMAYQLLTGYTPWPAELAKHRQIATPWPDAPERLRPEQWEALKRGLAYRKEERPGSCGELLSRLRRIEPVKPRPEPRPTPAPDQIEAQRRKAEEARRQQQQRQEKVERERLKAAFDEHLKAGRLTGPGETALSLLQSLHSSHPNAAETAEATQAYRAAVEQAVETALGQGRLDEVERQLKAAQAVLAQERRRHWQRRLIQQRAKAVQPQPEEKKDSGSRRLAGLIALGLIGLLVILGYSWWEQTRSDSAGSMAPITTTTQDRLGEAKAEAKRRAEEAARRQTEERRKQQEAEERRRAEQAAVEAKRRAEARQPFEPEMVEIPAGRFQMGCVSGRGCYDDEQPVHWVEIKPFEIGKYEVTFEEWGACVNHGGCTRNPSDQGWGRERRPVINVSWDDAQEYVRWLSGNTGKRYRLPSEAEWEYAARAGTTGPFSFNGNISPSKANYDGNYTFEGSAKGEYRGKTVEVGSFEANPWGLYDVHGNVWEWVEDCWHGSYSGASDDGSAWTQGGDCAKRVLRGGSWYVVPGSVRSAIRSRDDAGFRYDGNGLRVVRALSP